MEYLASKKVRNIFGFSRSNYRIVTSRQIESSLLSYATRLRARPSIRPALLLIIALPREAERNRLRINRSRPHGDLFLSLSSFSDATRRVCALRYVRQDRIAEHEEGNRDKFRGDIRAIDADHRCSKRSALINPCAIKGFVNLGIVESLVSTEHAVPLDSSVTREDASEMLLL